MKVLTNTGELIVGRNGIVIMATSQDHDDPIQNIINFDLLKFEREHANQLGTVGSLVERMPARIGIDHLGYWYQHQGQTRYQAPKV